MKKTKIVCTIGTKTESVEMLCNLLKSGMNVMRLNFSHANHEIHRNRINNLSSAIQITNLYASILLDTKGPEIRTMKVANKFDIYLNANQTFILVNDKNIIGNNTCVAVSYHDLYKDVNTGNTILIDDGLIKLKVINIIKSNIICRVCNSGFLGENKGVNIPGIKLNIPFLNERDKKDIKFAIKNNITFIAVSFVKDKFDVLKIRNFLHKNKGFDIQIISKIETRESLNNFDDILKVSDGVMIARGDLGAEIPIEEVIIAQKLIIKKCNFLGKAVITATHMLESMVKNPRPTRAEAGDVANAILDGTDAVMLSGETAKGQYPLQSVSVMSKICNKTDNVVCNNIQECIIDNDQINYIDIICQYIVEISKKLNISIIVVMTKTGKYVKYIRKYRPKAVILALTTNIKTFNQLTLIRGVICKIIDKIESPDEYYGIGKIFALETGIVNKGDVIIITGSLIYYNNINSISMHII